MKTKSITVNESRIENKKNLDTMLNPNVFILCGNKDLIEG